MPLLIVVVVVIVVVGVCCCLITTTIYAVKPFKSIFFYIKILNNRSVSPTTPRADTLPPAAMVQDTSPCLATRSAFATTASATTLSYRYKQ